jgi:hypothetical protein
MLGWVGREINGAWQLAADCEIDHLEIEIEIEPITEKSGSTITF